VGGSAGEDLVPGCPGVTGSPPREYSRHPSVRRTSDHWGREVRDRANPVNVAVSRRTRPERSDAQPVVSPLASPASLTPSSCCIDGTGRGSPQSGACARPARGARRFPPGLAGIAPCGRRSPAAR